MQIFAQLHLILNRPEFTGASITSDNGVMNKRTRYSPEVRERAVRLLFDHHSDRGSRYLSIRYTERLAEAQINASAGSVGDSYTNALAETINGLYKPEVIRRRGPWKNIEAIEYATLAWVGGFNNHRLLEPMGNVPPAEFEMSYYR